MRLRSGRELQQCNRVGCLLFCWLETLPEELGVVTQDLNKVNIHLARWLETAPIDWDIKGVPDVRGTGAVSRLENLRDS